MSDLAVAIADGKVVPGERERCIEAGADDCIAKPIDRSDFLSILTPRLPAKARSRR